MRYQVAGRVHDAEVVAGQVLEAADIVGAAGERNAVIAAGDHRAVGAEQAAAERVEVVRHRDAQRLVEEAIAIAVDRDHRRGVAVAWLGDQHDFFPSQPLVGLVDGAVAVVVDPVIERRLIHHAVVLRPGKDGVVQGVVRRGEDLRDTQAVVQADPGARCPHADAVARFSEELTVDRDRQAVRRDRGDSVGAVIACRIA